jgi:hypothetical protein
MIANGTGLADHPVDWYRKNGYDYIITSNYISDLTVVDPAMGQARSSFYRSLKDQFKLVKSFSAMRAGQQAPFVFDEIYGPYVSLWERERPGPEINIYQLGSTR